MEATELRLLPRPHSQPGAEQGCRHRAMSHLSPCWSPLGGAEPFSNPSSRAEARMRRLRPGPVYRKCYHRDNYKVKFKKIKINAEGFPGDPVVKNLPSSAGDTGSIPGPGRSHVPQSN